MPNPNGVYLPNGEEKNGQPVLKIKKAFLCGLMVQVGRLPIKLAVENLFRWEKRPLMMTGRAVTARFYPDEEYAKDATFRLAVAFQGSEDSKNAIRFSNSLSWISRMTNWLLRFT